MKIFKELSERWNAKSPDLFRKITNIALQLGTAAFGILVMNGVVDLTPWLPAIIFKICSYILVGAGAMGLTAKITKQDSNDSN